MTQYICLATTEDIECLRGNLPYVYIYDDEPFGKMQEHIEAENVEEFLNKIAKLIIENKIDAMVFDNFYPVYTLLNIK